MTKTITALILLLMFSTIYAKNDICTCAQFYKAERDMVKIQLFYFDSCLKTLTKNPTWRGASIDVVTKACIDAVNAQFSLATERAK
jgi:hypothetical protein